MTRKLTEPEWPNVDDFVSSQLPEGAEDPYPPDDQTPPGWWEAEKPIRPRKE